MDYFIGQGTSIVAEFSSLEKMFDFHRKMPSIDRHFCRLYDTKKGIQTEGWRIQYDYSDASVWTPC